MSRADQEWGGRGHKGAAHPSSSSSCFPPSQGRPGAGARLADHTARIIRRWLCWVGRAAPGWSGRRRGAGRCVGCLRAELPSSGEHDSELVKPKEMTPG